MYTVQVGGDMMITTTPILNIDKLDYQYAGLPLGTYSRP